MWIRCLTLGSHCCLGFRVYICTINGLHSSSGTRINYMFDSLISACNLMMHMILESGSHCYFQDRNFIPETNANCWISCRLELAVAWMAICHCKPNDFCKRSVAAIEWRWQRSCSSVFPSRCKWLLWQVQVLFSLVPLFWGFFYGIVHFSPFILCCFGHASTVLLLPETGFKFLTS